MILTYEFVVLAIIALIVLFFLFVMDDYGGLALLCIVCAVVLFIGAGYSNQTYIENQAIEDYQNYNVSLIKYSENNIYNDKIYELYQNEVDINSSAVFWIRFNPNC